MRVEGRGTIDRSTPVRFSFDGKTVSGFKLATPSPRRFWPTTSGSWAGPSSITARAGR
jgi:hypothetical protein